MGEFSKMVLTGQIDGPVSRSFKLSSWKDAFNKCSSVTDNDDLRIFEAGLFLNKVLEFIRATSIVDKINLCQLEKLRLFVGLSILNMKHIGAASRINHPKAGPDGSVTPSDFLQMKVAVPSTGQEFSPDELISSLGDGMKYIVRRCLEGVVCNDCSHQAASNNNLDEFAFETNVAIMYHVASELWGYFLGSDYEVVETDSEILLRSTNKTMEEARIASIYRRQKNELDIAFHTNQYIGGLRARGILMRAAPTVPVVDNVEFEKGEVKSITLQAETLDEEELAKSFSFNTTLANAFYEGISSQPLPNFSGLTLKEIISSWSLLQTVSDRAVKNIKELEIYNADDIRELTPIISKEILEDMFCSALNVEREKAKSIVDVFVFKGQRNQELWAQPLIPYGGSFLLSVSTIYSVSLTRIFEIWLRQGGYDLEKRGGNFERAFRERIGAIIDESYLKDSVYIIPNSIKIKVSKKQKEEIDALVVIGDSILLLELKCILWPEDSMQFLNYRRTIEGGVRQAIRKREFLVKNHSHLVDVLRKQRIPIPQNPKIIPCIVTNYAAYAGSPIDGVPVADINILKGFIENKFTLAQSVFRGNLELEKTKRFYSSLKEASDIIESYLMSPPQLKRMKQGLKPRRLTLPIELDKKTIHKDTWDVEINSAEVLREYGVLDASRA